MEKQKSAPRIYNLFPRLLGKIDTWTPHLKRILEMDFNWVYINPINYTGFSGSLYSTKDFLRLNPLFATDKNDEDSWGSFKTFITVAHSYGLKIMVDLVINHTAIDAIFPKSWYMKKMSAIDKNNNTIVRVFEKDTEEEILEQYKTDQYFIEERIARPYAVDPQDANIITIWGDLAEINYESDEKPSIMAYWKEVLGKYINLGVDGFRADAAYQVDPTIWEELITYTKQQVPQALFWAETLGCTVKQAKKIAPHFDYIANSVKYWDYTKPWATLQYNSFREIAPSISFPESHDTIRLTVESNGNKDLQIFKYLFSAFFTAGTLMPIGYEYGFEKRINVVTSTPDDWEIPHFDISNEIKQINILKKQHPILNEDGKITHIKYENSGILIIKKEDIQEKHTMLLIYNKDWTNENSIEFDLKAHSKNEKEFKEILLNGIIQTLGSIKIDQNLSPNEFHLYYY